MRSGHALECTCELNSTTTVPIFLTTRSSSAHGPGSSDVKLLTSITALRQELAKRNTTVNKIIHKLDFIDNNDYDNYSVSFINSLNALNSMLASSGKRLEFQLNQDKL